MRWERLDTAGVLASAVWVAGADAGLAAMPPAVSAVVAVVVVVAAVGGGGTLSVDWCVEVMGGSVPLLLSDLTGSPAVWV